MMKEGEPGAGIRIQIRTRTKINKDIKHDTELKEVRIAIEDMMERIEYYSRETGLERL
jgi:hypothetical protein